MRISWTRQTLRPRYAFATSRGAVTEKQTLVLELEHAGITGRGEAAPSALYGQTLETTEAAFEAMQPLLGDDPFRIEPILQRVLGRLDEQRAAVSALDAALHDWVGQRLGISVPRLLGLAPARARTTFTLGVAQPDELRRKLDEALAAGYDALKVKVGVDSDERNLALIRERFEGPLLLDANEAWSPKEAPGRIRALAPFHPTVIEQPLARPDWAAMRGLRELGVAPIYADESCERPADVIRLNGCVDGINVKFTKCGGIREALRMIGMARALGLGVMLGCFVSSSLAIAPALSIASRVDYADLDGHLLLDRDPFSGIERRGGTIWLEDRPGLAVVPAV